MVLLTKDQFISFKKSAKFQFGKANSLLVNGGEKLRRAESYLHLRVVQMLVSHLPNVEQRAHELLLARYECAMRKQDIETTRFDHVIERFVRGRRVELARIQIRQLAWINQLVVEVILEQKKAINSANQSKRGRRVEFTA